MKPEDGPIAWLFVERQETYRRDERDGSVFEASIRLSYERIVARHSHWMKSKGYFTGGFRREFGGGHVVSLTSETTCKGAVFLDLPELDGQRIGTYLMNEIVLWTKQWPDADVRPIELVEGQAHEDNKARRNRFYEQFGIDFDYHDPAHRSGVSRPMKVAALTPVATWTKNIRELDVREYLGEVLYAHDRVASELAQRDHALQNLRGDIKHAEAHPLRWALRRLAWRVAAPLIQITILAIVGFAMWGALKRG